VHSAFGASPRSLLTLRPSANTLALLLLLQVDHIRPQWTKCCTLGHLMKDFRARTTRCSTRCPNGGVRFSGSPSTYDDTSRNLLNILVDPLHPHVLASLLPRWSRTPAATAAHLKHVTPLPRHLIAARKLHLLVHRVLRSTQDLLTDVLEPNFIVDDWVSHSPCSRAPRRPHKATSRASSWASHVPGFLAHPKLSISEPHPADRSCCKHPRTPHLTLGEVLAAELPLVDPTGDDSARRRTSSRGSH